MQLTWFFNLVILGFLIIANETQDDINRKNWIKIDRSFFPFLSLYEIAEKWKWTIQIQLFAIGNS